MCNFFIFTASNSKLENEGINLNENGDCLKSISTNGKFHDNYECCNKTKSENNTTFQYWNEHNEFASNINYSNGYEVHDKKRSYSFFYF